MDEDTIVALATPPGRAGLAVVRISGTKTKDIVSKIISDKFFTIKPRYAKYVHFADDKSIIDDGLITYFKSPNSYTGEDTAEISVHSNPFIIERLIERIIKLGARQAMGGEFTYRAFINGKLDLIQAESINELINSNSKLSSQMIFNNLEGKLSKLMVSAKELLINLGIKVESSIEFGEDQYLEDSPIKEDLKHTLELMNKILSASRFNDVINKGFKIVIAGKVNVGKSSIFNELVLENRSIVSDIPGTTRDFIEKKIFINGFAFEIIDIAGFNENSNDAIEDEGIKRSIDKLNDSDAVIFVLDSSGKPDKNDMAIYERIKDKKHIIVANKKDISDNGSFEYLKKIFSSDKIHWVSVKKGDNVSVISEFLKTLTYELDSMTDEIRVNERQGNILKDLIRVVKDILTGLGTEDTEITAEKIREAIKYIGMVTGEVSTDDILNGIFSTFCIGK